MTVRVTSLYGDTAGAYYVEKPGQYYLDGDEPPGVWRGRGAGELGLAGVFDDEAFLALLAGLDPDTGERLGTRHTDKTVRGFDITFSAPKSVSSLFAVGDPDTRADVLAAHDAAVDAVMDWVEDHALVRHRVNGEVWVVDAIGTTSALFRQHTSRALDPQIHTHAVLVNRVLAPDGRWLALDARTLKHDQRTLSALYHGGLRAELTQRLGVAWLEPVNGIAEMAHVAPEVLVEFSARTRQVEDRIEVKVERFVESLGRMPTPRERWRLEREAVFDSRPAKCAAPADELHDRWASQVLGLGIDPADVVADTIDRARVVSLDPDTVNRVMARAVEALSERQSTWRPAEISRELAAAMPTGLALDAQKLAEVLEGLRVRVEQELLVDISRPVPDGVPLRRDGRPVTESVVQRALTTPDILAQEASILSHVERRIEAGGVDAGALPRCDIDVREQLGEQPGEQVRELTGTQLEVAAAVAGTRGLVLVVGPAGTGKTTALQPAAEQLRAEGRVVFGVAPSAAAAEVLATDTGVDADTIDKLLVEHRLNRPPDHRYALPAGATVLVDEAAMVSTPNLAELFALAERRQWRLALVGDPLQFSAVGRSGMFGYLIDQFGAIHLDQVHRFAEPWEREASLQLRRGDTSVVDTYDEHGRLHGGTPRQMARAVIDAWCDARAAGETVAMMAPTREAVVELNQWAQHRRMEAGEIGRFGRTVHAGDYLLREGDVVATRRNDRTVHTDQGLMVKNRDHWTIQHILDDGGLCVSGGTGTVDLAPGYVAEHVELAYAETSHANQGRTVDRSLFYLDGPTDTRGIYVPLTRGRRGNDAFVVTDGERTPADVIAEAVARTWIDRPAHEVRQELAAPDAPHVEHRDDAQGPRLLDPAELRAALERERDLRRTLEHAGITPDGRRAAERRITAMATERAGLHTTVHDRRAEIAGARDYLHRHDGPLSRRVHQGSIETARRTITTATGALDAAERRIVDLDSQIGSTRQGLADRLEVERHRPDPADEHQKVSEALGTDWTIRMFDIANHGVSRSVTDLIGPQPTGHDAAQLWLETAATIEQHQTAFDITDGLGPEPSWLNRDLNADSRREARRVSYEYNLAVGRTVPQQELGREIDYPGLSL